MDDLRGVLCFVGAVVLSACGTPDEFDDRMEFRDTFSNPGSGGWLGNGIEDPHVDDADPAYSLDSSEGLSNEGWLPGSEALETATYMVECALPAGESVTKLVDGELIELGGLLGLAPEWKTGECDEDCQEWISACLLARTNVSGEAVSIWVTGDHEALDWEVPTDAVLEAGFYGNLFADPEGRYLCKGSHHAIVAARREGRTCAGGDACGFTRYHNCTQHSRCPLDGPNEDVPTNCKTGKHATSAPYHTIATYVVP